MAEQTRVAAVIELGLEVKPVGGCAAAMGKLEEIHWFRRGMSVALACRAQRSIDGDHVFLTGWVRCLECAERLRQTPCRGCGDESTFRWNLLESGRGECGRIFSTHVLFYK